MSFDEVYSLVARMFSQSANQFTTQETICADLNITGPSSGVIGATIKNGKASVKKGTTGVPDAVVTVSADDLAAIINGKLKPLKAIITRKIKVSGNYEKLLQVMKTIKR